MKKKITIVENTTVITMNENRDIIENGVVVISDGVNTRSATADETYFYIGENTVINLGDKNIYFNN